MRKESYYTAIKVALIIGTVLNMINSYDNLGNVVYKKEGITENRVQLNTTGWNSGTYFITVTDNGGRVLKEKLVITK
jgi:hypothetical protein